MVSLETTDQRVSIYLQQPSGSHLHEHLSDVQQPQLLAHWQALFEEGLGQGQTILENTERM